MLRPMTPAPLALTSDMLAKFCHKHLLNGRPTSSKAVISARIQRKETRHPRNRSNFLPQPKTPSGHNRKMCAVIRGKSKVGELERNFAAVIKIQNNVTPELPADGMIILMTNNRRRQMCIKQQQQCRINCRLTSSRQVIV